MAIGGIIARFIKYDAVHDNGDSGAAKTIDWKGNGCFQEIVLSADCEFTFSNPIVGAVMLKIVVGSTPHTMTWPVNVNWPGGDAPQGDADTVILVQMYYDGVYYWGFSFVYSG